MSRRYWNELKENGVEVVRDMTERTKLELHARTDGNSIVTGIDAASLASSDPKCVKLRGLGYVPLGVDLGDVGLAAGNAMTRAVTQPVER